MLIHCQVGLWSAPLPRARAAEGAPRTHLCQQITSTLVLTQCLINEVFYCVQITLV